MEDSAITLDSAAAYILEAVLKRHTSMTPKRRCGCSKTNILRWIVHTLQSRQQLVANIDSVLRSCLT